MRRQVGNQSRQAVGAVAGRVDRLFNDTVLSAKRAPKGSPAVLARSLEELIARFHDARWLTDVDGFFGQPELPVVQRTPVRLARATAAGRSVEDLHFRSPHQPYFGEAGQRFAAFEQNREVYARRILAGAAPSDTAMVLVHGYLGGALGAEEWLWPIHGFLQRGVDVVLAVLPFHGKRHDRGLRRPPRWPGPDLTFALEGFRQVVADLRALVLWLRQGEGYAHVGMMGMSLGGFSTALMATVEPGLSLAVPYIPLASVADWSRDAGQLPGDSAQQAELYRLLEAAHALVSPLSRPLALPRERCFVAVAERDAITPKTHGARIARHFDVPLEVFPGGHILQTGRAQAFRRVYTLLDELRAGRV